MCQETFFSGVSWLDYWRNYNNTIESCINCRERGARVWQWDSPIHLSFHNGVEMQRQKSGVSLIHDITSSTSREATADGRTGDHEVTRKVAGDGNASKWPVQRRCLDRVKSSNKRNFGIKLPNSSEDVESLILMYVNLKSYCWNSISGAIKAFEAHHMTVSYIMNTEVDMGKENV